MARSIWNCESALAPDLWSPGEPPLGDFLGRRDHHSAAGMLDDTVRHTPENERIRFGDPRPEPAGAQLEQLYRD